jgi:Reverse transcriptase (RNA-dependent DNA polymerase)
MSAAFDSFCKENGILREFTTPYTPQHNGVAERMNRTLIDSMLSMIAAANAPGQFWAEALLTAVYVRNRVPTTAVEGKTPYEVWNGTKPNVQHLRIFGCHCYAHFPKEKRQGKLNYRAIPCRFLGYDPERKCYRLWDTDNKKLLLSRDVQFDENSVGFDPNNDVSKLISDKRFVFSSSTESTSHSPAESPPHISHPQVMTPTEDSGSTSSSASETQTSSGSDSCGSPDSDAINIPDDRQNDEFEPDIFFDAQHDPIVDDATPLDLVHNDCDHSDASGSEISKIDSTQRENDKNDFDSESNADASPTPTNDSPSTVGISEAILEDVRRYPLRLRRRPRPYYEQANAANSLEDWEPNSLKDALMTSEASEWIIAANDEMNSLLKHQTWELTTLPAGRKAVGSRWVFRRKLKQNGDIDRYKARLVAQGYTQVEGVDYQETYAPVASMKAIRCLIAVSVELGLHLHQMDVKTAFLNGILEEDIYMKQPEGYIKDGQEHLVCKLKRSLYGLKQSPRVWNSVLHTFLCEQGFTACETEMCIYFKRANNSLMMLSVYVDDLIIASDCMNTLNAMKRTLSARFEMSDMGEMQYCLGVQVKRDSENNSVTLTQERYIREFLADFGMENSATVSTPIIEPSKVVVSKNDMDVKSFPYRKAIGKLMYAALVTRPDIAFAVNYHSRFQENPQPEHIQGVKRIMRYLNGCADYGIKYSPSGNHSVQFCTYSDADWGADKTDRKSTSAYVVMMCKGTVSWRCAKQDCVSTSTMEAEYVALKFAAQETVWMRMMLRELGLIGDDVVTVYEDNEGAIALTANKPDHGRSKHIDISYHYTRDQIHDKKNIKVVYCKTQDMLADLLTKPLAADRFKQLRAGIGMVPSLSGSVE